MYPTDNTKLTDMSINLKKIIETQHLDKHYVAAALFPAHTHPDRALSRVMSGEGVLDADQVVVLSQLTRLPVGFLYTSNEWTVGGNLDKLVFSSSEVTAELNTNDWITKIVVMYEDGNATLYKTISGNIPLQVYLSDLTEYIIKNV